ncbi:MAG: hypothetical protein K2L34_00370 [Muribaculaceae bacterium]|nr:hypothetical protein [Muribaculaceae bacterium]
MKLEDAWLKIKEMENCDRFKPNQIHAILADLGIFNTNPRIRLVLKTALTYGLWDIILKGKGSSGNKIKLLKLRLQNYGFSGKIVNEVLICFLDSPSFNDSLTLKGTDTNNIQLSPSSLKQESDINFELWISEVH